MDDWEGLRTAAIVLVWLTVGGGLLLATMWFAFGGARAVGPEDEIMSQAGTPPDPARRTTTSFSSAQVGMHGLLAVLTALLVTYGATLRDDRSGGYVALLGSLAVTAIPGVLMFWKWHTKKRPHVKGVAVGVGRPRVEDRLPKLVVYAHGLAAVATISIIVVLLVVDQ
jgi:hypothetical protein